jgi:preprotein translocase subunit SecG
MNLIGILFLVVFVIVAVLLILMVLIQGEDGDSLGGFFSGGSASAFGSRSGNILTKTTYVLGALFMISSFGLALINRTPADTGVEAAAIQQAAASETGQWWVEPAAPAADATLPASDAAAPATDAATPATAPASN